MLHYGGIVHAIFREFAVYLLDQDWSMLLQPWVAIILLVVELNGLDVEEATVGILEADGDRGVPICLSELLLLIDVYFGVRLGRLRARLQVWLTHVLHVALGLLPGDLLLSELLLDLSFFLGPCRISDALPGFDDQNLDVVYEYNFCENFDADAREIVADVLLLEWLCELLLARLHVLLPHALLNPLQDLGVHPVMIEVEPWESVGVYLDLYVL